MAALIDVGYLRGTFNIDRSVGDGRLNPYIAPASRRLSGWVGAANYASTDLADELKLAEGLIAMHLLQLNLNTNIRPKGLVRREVVEGSVTVEYLSPKDVETSAGAFLDQAEEIVRSFSEATSEAMPAIVTASGSQEGATRWCGRCSCYHSPSEYCTVI